MDQDWLFTVLIWLLVILGVAAIVLGVLVAVARRIPIDDDGDSDDGDLPQHPPRPTRGGKPTPLNLTPCEYTGLGLADFHHDHRALRDFGELVTVAALAAHGWNKLPSRLQGGQGIDLLMVRELGDVGGYEARAIEVKTNTISYNPETMSDERIAGALGRLHDAGAFDAATLEELLRGLWEGPPYFRKELWRHQLDSGATTIFDLDEFGQKCGSEVRSSGHLMDALFQIIKQFDRRADYVDRPVVEAPPEEILHAAATRRPKKRKRSLLQAYARAFSFRPKRGAARGK